jgi:hypothetical protein
VVLGIIWLLFPKCKLFYPPIALARAVLPFCGRSCLMQDPKNALAPVCGAVPSATEGGSWGKLCMYT